MRTDEVFGIAAQYRPVSYVDRGQLDIEIQTYLARDTHIALRGESKCGKSWLRQKNIPNAIIVQCRLGKTVTDIYIDALSQLEIKLEVESHSSGSIKGKISATGSIGNKILATLGLGTNLEMAHQDDTKHKSIGHDINDLRYFADIIKNSGRRLVVEDFHYMSISERKKFAFELKALWDYGLFVIIVGIWNRNNMILYLNPDLSGRIHELSVSWTDNDLMEVLNKGGEALNIFLPRILKGVLLKFVMGMLEFCKN